ncbi:MAG: OmpA family protein [Pseudomonadales bacterium]|nr:OmpA family protein [Pseudomonadales bacterium]
MKKLIATFAASALALGISAAAQADAHPYAGLGVGYAYGDNSGNTVGGQLGYHFNQDWSAELSYYDTVDQNEVDVTSITGAYRLWGEQTQLLALASVNNLNMESHDADNGMAVGLGLGLSHYFTDQLEMRASVQSLVWQDHDDDLDALATLALNYHFGTHEEAVAEPEPEKVAPAVVMTKTLHAHFDTDKSKVRAADRAEIVPVAQAMKANPGSTATIVGHTDSTASEAYNQGLSERRAEAVKQVMVEEGVNPEAIETSGRGELEPVAGNDTAAGRQENRRIEAVVTGLPQ